MAIGVELAAVGVELIPGIAAADNITIGTSTITSGTSGRILYDNAGVIGEKTVTGTGSVVLANTPTLITPVLGVATGTSLALGGATIGANAMAVTGTASFGGKVTVVSGNAFQIGNAATTGLVAGALAALTNATIVIADSTGQAYRIPCII